MPSGRIVTWHWLAKRMVESKEDRWRTDVEVAVKSGGGGCWVGRDMLVRLCDCVSV